MIDGVTVPGFADGVLLLGFTDGEIVSKHVGFVVGLELVGLEEGALDGIGLEIDVGLIDGAPVTGSAKGLGLIDGFDEGIEFIIGDAVGTNWILCTITDKRMLLMSFLFTFSPNPRNSEFSANTS